MSVWVDCIGGPSWFGGWAADMGPWTGTWPMLAPGEMSGLDASASDELDFVIGLPNAAHPGDPYYALDGSYASPLWDAYRYLNSGTPPPASFDGYQLASVGGATTPTGTDTPPAGAHLYVVAYMGAPPPPNPPEFYVPPSYAAGGMAALQTLPGGWSAWQSGSAHTVTNMGVDGTVTGDWQSTCLDGTGGVNADGHATSYVAARPLAQGAIDAAVPGATAVLGNPGGGIASMTVDKRPNPFILGDVYTDADVIFNQIVAAFNAHPDNPDPLGSLINFIDYEAQPWVGDTYEYVSPDPAVFGWGALHVEAAGAQGLSDGTGAGVFPLVHSLRYELLTGPVTVGTTGLASGTEFASTTVRSDDTIPSGHIGIPVDLTLPGGADAATKLAVSAGPEFLYTGLDAAAYPDIAPIGRYSWQIDFQWVGIDYSWTTTQWRYWLPNPIEAIAVSGGYWGVSM